MSDFGKSKTRRRQFGGICLATAILMLIAGETVLKPMLGGVLLLAYWLVCFVLTALAAGAAIIDAARVREEMREQQRVLLEDTVRKIERERQSRTGSQRRH